MMIYALAADGWCEIARLGVDAERGGGRSSSSLMSTAIESETTWNSWTVVFARAIINSRGE